MSTFPVKSTSKPPNMYFSNFMSTICQQFVILWSFKQENEEAEEAEMPYKTRKVVHCTTS